MALIEPVYPWKPGIRSYIDFAAHVYYRLTKRIDYHTRSVSQLRIVDQGKYVQLKLKLISNMWSLRRYFAYAYPERIHIFSTHELFEKSPFNFQVDWDELAIEGLTVMRFPAHTTQSPAIMIPRLRSPV